MKPEDLVRPEILALKAYPVASAEGMVKLDAMENPYSLPEPLRRELAAVLARVDVNRYPTPSPQKLRDAIARDRKSTRLNSSHSQISYAVFCLKKKKKNKKNIRHKKKKKKMNK